MYNRNDPRFRRTLNQISQNLESANESAQLGLFSFSENYIKPCFNSITTFVEPCAKECFPDPRERSRRNARARGRTGRLEHSFDFYDDWEADETDALLALEDDEFDRVVGGYGTQDSSQQSQHSQPQQQPPAHRARMNYGQRPARPHRKNASLPYDVNQDPTAIPNQSYFGFLARLPFNIGKGRLRYKPSAADLQDRTKGETSTGGEEIDALLEEDEEDDSEAHNAGRRRRKRSGTTSSGHTTDSFSSRGDIFPSDDEADAIPLDDEFTVALERRTTNSASGSNAAATNTTDDTTSSHGTGSRVKKKKKPPVSDASSDASAKNRKNRNKERLSRKSSSSTPRSVNSLSDPEMGELPSLSTLMHEDERAREDEEVAVEKSRVQALHLAVERGLAPAPAEQMVKAESDIDADGEEAAVSYRQHPPVDVEVADGPIQLEDNDDHEVSEPHKSDG